MKPNKPFILAILTIIASIPAAIAALPAPLPDFKSPQELATEKKNAEQANTNEYAATHIFYTGKTFESDQESYLFKYRNYDPEQNRWMSADPSGFPDGPNGHIYLNNPVSIIDPNGLAGWSAVDFASHYFFGKQPYAKGGEVNLGATGNGDAIRNHTYSNSSIYESEISARAEDASYFKKPSFTLSGTITVNLDYQSVCFALGNSNLRVDYDIDGSGSIGFNDVYNYTYTADLQFYIDDEFVDALDIMDWFPGNQDAVGGQTFAMVYDWTSVTSGSGSYE